MIVAVVCWKMAAGALDARVRDEQRRDRRQVRRDEEDPAATRSTATTRSTPGVSRGEHHSRQGRGAVDPMYEQPARQGAEVARRAWRRVPGIRRGQEVPRPDHGRRTCGSCIASTPRSNSPRWSRSSQAQKMPDATPGVRRRRRRPRRRQRICPAAAYPQGGACRSTPTASRCRPRITSSSGSTRGRSQIQLDFQDRPTSLQIWVTQEDLWVYETLLQRHRRHERGIEARRGRTTRRSRDRRC